jgi:hypothetical protein
MNYNWYDFVGNVGVAFILAAYLMLQAKKISSEKYLYSLMNGLGALLIIVSLIFDFNLSAFIIEFFWFLISIYGLIKTINSKK